MNSGRDKTVEVKTYIHTDDITYINDDPEGSVFVMGTDRCGWHFSGFMSRAALAPILFPEAITAEEREYARIRNGYPEITA